MTIDIDKFINKQITQELQQSRDIRSRDIRAEKDGKGRLRECVWCGESFLTLSHQAPFCSHECYVDTHIWSYEIKWEHGRSYGDTRTNILAGMYGILLQETFPRTTTDMRDSMKRIGFGKNTFWYLSKLFEKNGMTDRFRSEHMGTITQNKLSRKAMEKMSKVDLVKIGFYKRHASSFFPERLLLMRDVLSHGATKKQIRAFEMDARDNNSIANLKVYIHPRQGGYVEKKTINGHAHYCFTEAGHAALQRRDEKWESLKKIASKRMGWQHL